MRKIIAAINMTIDGYCDHTGFQPDEEIHQHYAELMRGADAILYGRITYELMKFWQDLVINPSGDKSMDDFAVAMDKVAKIVFSNTMKDTGWDSAALSTQPIDELIADLKTQPGRDIFIGSRSLIMQLLNLNVIDEYQLCIHPVIVGKGLPLFDKINDRTIFTLLKTKIFGSGAIILYYKRS